MKPVPSYSKDITDLVTCNVDTEYSVKNIESDFLYQWYKNDLPIVANSYVIRLSFTSDALKRDPYISHIASRQGYYHCEVQLPGSSEKYSSQKIKVSYTGTIIFPFLIDVLLHLVASFLVHLLYVSVDHVPVSPAHHT